MVVIIPLPSSVALNLPWKTTENIKHVQFKSLPRSTLYLSAVKNQKTLFFPLSPGSLLLGVIQCSNKVIMDDRQTIFGRQCVSLPNIFVAEDIFHYLPKFVAMWNPPFSVECVSVGGRFHLIVLPRGIDPSKGLLQFISANF